ncbi:GntR family transcriptional regulator [Lapidilactobacillus luobeiensis]|uniref:GntR family transcriptional regulator n=1 Tax=Lapidilactobacillus luobeiensis TaxID=2950371 RepID=UPI0021C482A5|nr:GntR family transcriptional regulator [Lapidilactobacillus luobeiensis]
MEKKYEIVTETVKGWIITGKYKENEKIPTESKLMATFEVSRHTIRKALSDLEVQGLVYRIQGGGTFVASQRQRIEKSIHKTVAVMATHINDYIFPAIISGIEKVLSEQSVSLLLSSTRNDEKFEQNNLIKLLSTDISGLIVEPTKSAFTIKNEGLYADLQKTGVPIITINSKFKELVTPYFIMDDFAGGKLATEYILTHRHQKILGVFKTDDQQGIDRMDGFTYAIQSSNRVTDINILTYKSGELEEELPIRLRKVVANLENRPTAIICYNDQIAALVYNQCLGLGLNIPEDISIISFDNSMLSSNFGTRITSIDHPKTSMGQDAAKLMLQMLGNSNRNFIESSRIYQPKVIAGDSVRTLGS